MMEGTPRERWRAVMVTVVRSGMSRHGRSYLNSLVWCLVPHGPRELMDTGTSRISGTHYWNTVSE